MTHKKVAIIGAGIAGLASAYYLQKNSPETQILIFESESKTGGKLLTSAFAGVSVDEGADSFLARVPWAVELCRDLGLESELVSPSARTASLWIDGKLQQIPSPNVLGVPLETESISEGLLTPDALSRLDSNGVPSLDLPDSDASIGQVIQSCVGLEVLERLVDPLIGGINAGRSDEMSCAVMAPQLLEAAHHPDGMLSRLKDLAKNADPTAPVFHTHPEGINRLVDALTNSLKNSFKMVRPVLNISRLNSKWLVETEKGPESVDGVVIATPASVSSNILEKTLPGPAQVFDSIEFASVVLVTFGYSRTDFEADSSQSGFLVPRSSQLFMTACSYSGSKWAHLRHPELEILRVSTGRIDDNRHLNMTDDEIVNELRLDLNSTLGIESAPVDVRVTRWPNSLPQFPVGHADQMNALDAELGHSAPGMFFAGAIRHGVGIPACIRSGKEAAQQLSEFLYG